MLDKYNEIKHLLNSIEKLFRNMLHYPKKTLFREKPSIEESVLYLRRLEEVTMRYLKNIEEMSYGTKHLEESFKLLGKHVLKTVKTVDVIEKAQDFIKQELHTFLVAHSLGLDINAVYRF